MNSLAQNQDFVLIENHFGVPNHVIRVLTRNKCSTDYVEALQEIARILYPEDSFEIFVLPAEPGSYKDVIKLVITKGKKAGQVIVVGGALLGYLTYHDTHQEHLHNQKMNIVDDTQKCLSLQKDIQDIGEKYEIENLPTASIATVCGSLTLKKKKNDLYTTLNNDDMVGSNEIILKASSTEIVSSKTINRAQFSDFIEPVIDQKYSRENLEGIIELTSAVVRQKKEGKGITWRGTYYGQDINYHDVKILQNGDDIDFYMQDTDFKEQIISKERVFASEDTMRIIFDIKADIKAGIALNKAIYIRSVVNYNEDVIPHNTKLKKVDNSPPPDQQSLFDNLPH